MLQIKGLRLLLGNQPSGQSAYGNESFHGTSTKKKKKPLVSASRPWKLTHESSEDHELWPIHRTRSVQ